MGGHPAHEGRADSMIRRHKATRRGFHARQRPSKGGLQRGVRVELIGSPSRVEREGDQTDQEEGTAISMHSSLRWAD
jgi:hypothetical protein